MLTRAVQCAVLEMWCSLEEEALKPESENKRSDALYHNQSLQEHSAATAITIKSKQHLLDTKIDQQEKKENTSGERT